MVVLAVALAGCPGTRDDSSEADKVGVGAACEVANDCEEQSNDTGGEQLECLTTFLGGYCGLEGCADNDDCPDGSACVNHEGANYCFRICLDKSECNENRPADVESNCSANVDFVDPDTSVKACVPPSGG